MAAGKSMPQATAGKIETQALEEFLSLKWDDDIAPRLGEYIRIPCGSSHFAPDRAGNTPHAPPGTGAGFVFASSPMHSISG
jgi:hypothetical protein